MAKNMMGILLAVVFVTSCGGRLPSAKTAQSVSKSYFTSYGRKHKDTQYSGKNVETVLINNIYELHFQTALVDSHVVLKNGGTERVLVTMQKKFPTGWNVQSWEILSGGDE